MCERERQEDQKHDSDARSVALQIVVDVDRDTGVGPFVRTGKCNLGRVGAPASGDLDLGAPDVLRRIQRPFR